jgi:hypothetical protein
MLSSDFIPPQVECELAQTGSQTMRAVWKYPQCASKSSRRQTTPRVVHDAILW